VGVRSNGGSIVLCFVRRGHTFRNVSDFFFALSIFDARAIIWRQRRRGLVGGNIGTQTEALDEQAEPPENAILTQLLSSRRFLAGYAFKV
jgi:hypothetical protein